MYTTIYKSIEELMPLIVTHGRVKLGTGGELRLPWSASGFTLTFSGEAVAVELLPYVTSVLPMADKDQLYASVKLILDGVSSHSIVAGEGSVLFANGLSSGNHTLTVLKENETDEPLRIKGVRVYGDDPAILKAARPMYSFKLEFIGDSITCGYGAWGTEPCFIPYQESATSTYAYLTAEALNAEARIISWSGRGIVKSYSGGTDNRFIDFFSQCERMPSEGKHDFALWQPDAIVINGGTNDAALDRASDDEFLQGLEETYKYIRSVYPEAVIVFAYGAMGNPYDGVYRKLIDSYGDKDGKLHYLPLRELNPEIGEHGASTHPSAKAHRRIADELINELKRLGFGNIN